jgi:hypothetical protein
MDYEEDFECFTDHTSSGHPAKESEEVFNGQTPLSSRWPMSS